MKSSKEYIESGILELYVLGNTTPEETKEVEEMAAAYYEVQNEINEIRDAFERYALAHAVTPDPIIKPFLMATIDYMDRMEKGEAPAFPPVLNEHSTIEDYQTWLERSDMILPKTFQDIHAKIIGYTPQVTTAIVWIKEMAPQEVHTDEHERFFILEGTCDITIGEDVYQLIPGDYLTIPLHKNHTVKVTSTIPCKVILQRIAA